MALHLSIPTSNTSLTQQGWRSPRLSQGEGQSLASFSDLVNIQHCSANASESTANNPLLTAQTLSSRGKLVQAASFECSICKASCCLHTALFKKLDTTIQSCPVTLTNRRHRFLCLLRAAQLPSPSCVFTLVSAHTAVGFICR